MMVEQISSFLLVKLAVDSQGVICEWQTDRAAVCMGSPIGVGMGIEVPSPRQPCKLNLALMKLRRTLLWNTFTGRSLND